MRQRILIAMLAPVIFLFTGIVYAGNGDLIVNGNLGVGTSTPGAKAEVNGNLKVDGTITTSGANGNLTVNGSSTVSGSSTVTQNLTINGNVGIGTSSPTQKLDVNGYVKGTGFCIGANCTTTLQVSGGLYGYSQIISSGGFYGSFTCSTTLFPATCASGVSACPAGYTKVLTGTYSEFNDGYTYAYKMYSCLKN
jgi:hypothetical protein